jgi:hypothetical protein
MSFGVIVTPTLAINAGDGWEAPMSATRRGDSAVAPADAPARGDCVMHTDLDPVEVAAARGRLILEAGFALARRVAVEGRRLCEPESRHLEAEYLEALEGYAVAMEALHRSCGPEAEFEEACASARATACVFHRIEIGA